MARLRTTVHVVDLEGRPRAFGPGEDLPDWAAGQIRNPDVWEGELPAHLDEAGGVREQIAVQVEAQPEMPEPPRSGTGSGRDAWAAYATRYGVDVPDGASRNDIVNALAARGLIETG
jgi:hypothetical protein